MWERTGIRFELHESLGSGAQGQVYRATRRDLSTGLADVVAVKILHSKNAVELWKREFESLRRVRSIYCLQVFGFERVEGHPALIMEYVDGVSLAQLSGGLPQELIDEILAQVEFGLKDLHAHGLAHGDLSPRNILIDGIGNIRLLDFGLANQGQNGQCTPEFAAPERLSGQEASWRTDLFSLGRVAEFLGGAVPKEYGALEPEMRTWRNRASTPHRRQALGAQVRRIKQRLEQVAAIKTRAVEESPILRPWSWQALFFALSFPLFLSSSVATSYSAYPPAVVVVRTNQWHHLSLNGQALGYAPLTVPIPAYQPTRLQWTNANGKGEKILRLRPGEKVLLHDGDLSR